MPEKVNYNPDILSCLANLSSDEVFTPPEIANSMLDMLPQELFKSPDTKFLDPGCKSGVFLREIAKRLNEGLKDKIPNVEQRMDHIMKNQLFAIAITQITGLMARRSVYCSKDASSRFSITRFENSDGNIRYRRIEHTWENGRCAICGASKDVQDRGEELESHAYEFIHMDKATEKELKDMKFDVIIGNPPYQLSVGVEKENYAIPIYQKFVEQAKKLRPRYLTMIIPSRWFTGGRGLDEFRYSMLNDKAIREIVDYTDSKDCFPGVDVSGGVSYFLWDRDYRGLCEFTNIHDGLANKSLRNLSEFDLFIRYNESMSIIHKVKNKSSLDLSTLVGPQTPFGFITTFHGKEKAFPLALTLHSSFGITYVSRAEVTKNKDWIDKYKVFFSKATSEHAGTPARDGKFRVFSTMGILEPEHICSQSYLIGGAFKTMKEAKNYCRYLKTRFVRFLLLQALTSQDISREKFIFVPMQDFSKSWSDEDLYKEYNLTQEEVSFIESMIKPMDIEGGADA